MTSAVIGDFWRYGDFLLLFKGSLIYLFILGTRKRNKNDGSLKIERVNLNFGLGSKIDRIRPLP